MVERHWRHLLPYVSTTKSFSPIQKTIGFFHGQSLKHTAMHTMDNQTRAAITRNQYKFTRPPIMEIRRKFMNQGKVESTSLN